MYLHQITGRTCFHCNAVAGFYILHAAPESEKRKYHDGRIEWVEGKNIRAMVCCTICRQPALFVLKPKAGLNGAPMRPEGGPHSAFLNRLKRIEDVIQNPNLKSHQQSNWAVTAESRGREVNAFYDVISEYPQSAVQQTADETLPPKLQDQLRRLNAVMHEPFSAMAASRRAIEMACKEKLGDAANGKKLYQMIDLAMEQVDATKEVAAWAHTIRHLGNDAVHGDDSDPTEEEARQAYEVVKFLLDLLFAYPERIKKIRNNKQ